VRTPEFSEDEYFEDDNKFLPEPEKWVPPRLIIINSDKTGVEFLNEEQMDRYFRMNERNIDCYKIVEDG